MVAAAKAGFRALAPDYRGYGLSDPPPEPEKASFKDIIAVLDALSIDKVRRTISYVFTIGPPIFVFL